jgi:FtsH-binding integral membrane protein
MSERTCVETQTNLKTIIKQKIMKKVIIERTTGIVIGILCVMVIGIIVPLSISVAVACLTSTTMLECTSSTPFWLGFTVMAFFGTIFLSIED